MAWAWTVWNDKPCRRSVLLFRDSRRVNCISHVENGDFEVGGLTGAVSEGLSMRGIVSDAMFFFQARYSTVN